MPFFSRVFFAIACFFRLLFDGRFAAAVETTKVLPAPPHKDGAKAGAPEREREERHAIPPEESQASEGRDTDSMPPHRVTPPRDTVQDLMSDIEASDEDDDEPSVPPVSTESQSTGLRHRSPPKPNTVPPPPDAEVSHAPATEPSGATGSHSKAELAVAAEAPGAAPTEDPSEKATTSPESGEAAAELGPPPAATIEPGCAARERGALLLLALLQREGRFVDFLQQDVTDFDDEQVGAAARVVHEGCRKALKGHLKVSPIRSEAEGDKVTLAEGYDVQATKLVGNVSGKPPYKGSLQHRGWRADHLQLPSEVGDHDPSVLAQAEVEL